MRMALAASLSLVSLSGCVSVAPPPSQFPSADAALERMQRTQACGTGVRAQAKIDHFGERGRVRGDLMLYAVRPAKLRMDAISPFGVALATLTSDGQRFTLMDKRENRFYTGPAKACNIARLSTVAIPGHVLGGLLRGLPPVLVHDARATTLVWNKSGYYVITIASTRSAREELHLAPVPEDFQKPWSEQRLRLLDVLISQHDGVLYHAELDGHARASAAAAPDEEIIPGEPRSASSGPACEAELPRSIHLEVPGAKGADVLFRYETVVWNPPVAPDTFTQPIPGGMVVTPVDCD